MIFLFYFIIIGKLTGPLAQLEVNREEIAPIRPIGAGQVCYYFEQTFC